MAIKATIYRLHSKEEILAAQSQGKQILTETLSRNVLTPQERWFVDEALKKAQEERSMLFSVGATIAVQVDL